MSEQAQIIKRPLVLWSGGLDSTALVIDLLYKGDIDVMYVDLDNNKILQRHEKKAIKKLKRIIEDANPPGEIINEHSFGYDYIEPSKSVYAQPALWITAAAFIADVRHHTSVNIAYIKHDDAWHYKTEIINTYNAMNVLICDGNTVPLEFLFEWSTKQNIVDNLKDFVYYKQIMQTIRYCEANSKEQCGKCHSCVRHTSEIKEVNEKRLMKVTVDIEKELIDVPG